MAQHRPREITPIALSERFEELAIDCKQAMSAMDTISADTTQALASVMQLIDAHEERMGSSQTQTALLSTQMGHQQDWTERQLAEGQEQVRELKVLVSQLQVQVRENHDARMEVGKMIIRHQDTLQAVADQNARAKTTVEALALNVDQLESLRVNHESDMLHRMHSLEDDLSPQFREMEDTLHQFRSDHLRHIEEGKVERERWESRMVRRLDATNLETGNSLVLQEGLVNDMLERMLDMKQQLEAMTSVAQAGPSQPSRPLVQEKPASVGHPVRASQPRLEQGQVPPVHLPSPDVRRIHYGAAAIRNGPLQ